ncbi:type II secretion system F family protein [Malonomonas rubra]|uniref:type II secretion system F family protein n=1 Tax=Malonomonas rubra TaxID=57040 RepID=UPI0026F19F2F|nr:type II secretion system F family protein [Malonomonas rubra]
MPSYLCKIGTSDGRVVEREFEAASKEQLRASLEEQGFSVFVVQSRPFQALVKSGAVNRRFKGRQFLTFNQELLVMIRSGLPILQVLDTLLERMEPGAFRNALRDIREDVRGGSVLSESFEKFPQFFPYLYVAAIKAGERTGDLPVTLERFIAYQKRVEAVRSKVREASFYPALLGFVTISVLSFLILWVVPRFSQIYIDSATQLPWVTRALIGFSGGVVKMLPLLVLIILCASVFFRFWVSTEKGRLLFDRLKLKLPFFGALQLEYALSGFCRTLATVLTSGIPLVTALQMSRGTLNNRLLEDKLLTVTHAVEEGGEFARSLEGTEVFPILALRMIGAGEKTGALPEMLLEVSSYYESAVEQRLERLTSMIEPLMMLVMGLMIGGVVIAMYIPIFQLAGTVR